MTEKIDILRNLDEETFVVVTILTSLTRYIFFNSKGNIKLFQTKRINKRVRLGKRIIERCKSRKVASIEHYEAIYKDLRDNCGGTYEIYKYGDII